VDILIMIVAGLVAGFLAGKVVRGRGFGIVFDILIGLAGAFIGGFIFSRFGFLTEGFLRTLISAFVGAVLLLVVIKLIRRI
jgi:uncharacterized membrane protein YeaQ/YmgE (transglycosylase-associated protein family)